MMRFLEQFASASIASPASTASPFSAQAILDGLSDAVLVVNADSTLLYASRGWQSLSGHESRDPREDMPPATRADGHGTAAPARCPAPRGSIALGHARPPRFAPRTP
ncbi:hypothetical protein [Cobetia sp. 29-18-1]|uniref:PAS domain-containing protein n=1 Tax=Cobetia sp. 29-18-1 TaxID=3040018 RepID=UPI0024474194|nr:hypothetical protein [Cobetia sp. 29-18-1]MDH2297645.1 hypothetical protein [Cobetia sp. 29-18-1]